MNDDTELEIRRLRWQCRRGMLELDFLLERYLDQRYAAAPVKERVLFQDLLGLQDPLLNEWLVTGSSEPEPKYRQLVSTLRRI